MISICEVIDRQISLSPEWAAKIDELLYKGFVKKLCGKNQSVNYYVSQRNALAKKAEEDIFVSKKTEYLTMVALCKLFGFPKIKLDLEIRHGNNKGWAHDLPFNFVDANYPNVHVKACTDSTYKYCNDYSWTFQYGNNNHVGGKDHIFKSGGNDLVVLIHLSQPASRAATIKAILPTNLVLQQDENGYKYLKDPLKYNLRGLKKCLYYRDLININQISSSI